jgi:hypothetical protein
MLRSNLPEKRNERSVRRASVRRFEKVDKGEEKRETGAQHAKRDDQDNRDELVGHDTLFREPPRNE